MKLYKIALSVLLVSSIIFSFSCNRMKKKETNPDVVFIGNSIIEYWGMANMDFFTDNNFVNKGVSGQTTNEISTRFNSDVIALNPKLVIIEGGINDIAENGGSYDPNKTLDNLKSMVEKAKEKNIKIILTSLLPTDSIHWNTKITDVSERVSDLNTKIREYATQEGFIYADLYSNLVDTTGLKMVSGYTIDGVHLSETGYKTIEPIIKEAIDRAIGVKY